MNGGQNGHLDNVVKILGMDGKEVPRTSRWPRIDIRTDCNVCGFQLKSSLVVRFSFSLVTG